MDEDLVEYGFRRVIITVICIVCALLEIVDTSIVNVALPNMAGNLDASFSEITWVIAAYAIANVIVVPMSGWFSRKFGRRNYFAVSIAIFTVASLMCGQATNLWELVAFRFIQGCGGGALLATSQTILTESYPKAKRGLSTAIFGMGVIIGPTLGPPLGGWITDNFSWPYIFYVNLPLGIAACILTLQFVRSPKFEGGMALRNAPIDWLGIGLLALGVGALQLVLEKGQEEDWFNKDYILIAGILSFLGIFFFVWREFSTPHPVVDLRVLKNRNLAIGTALSFILGFGLYGTTLVIPQFAQYILGFSATQAGLLFIPASLTTGLMMPVVGTLIGKGIKSSYLLTIGFSVFFIFCFWMYLTLTPQSGESDLFWPLIARGFGLGFLFIPVINLSLSTLKGKEIADGAAFTGMMRQLGGSFGIAIITTYLIRREQNIRNSVVQHLNINDPNVSGRLASTKALLMSKGYSSDIASNMALRIMDLDVIKQTNVLAYMQVFIALGIFFLLCIPFTLMVKQAKEKVDTSMAH
jgi:DHA2 family multidrug resistance protein